MNSQPIYIHWFRQDLRIADNPSLSYAADQGRRLLPIYILDDENAGEHKLGGASRWWLHYALKNLDEALDGNLHIYRGKAEDVIAGLSKNHDIAGVYWNRGYEPWRIDRDAAIKEVLEEQGIEAKSFNGRLLWEPWVPLKNDGTPYRVFTPFYKRGCLGSEPPREPLPVPQDMTFAHIDDGALTLDDLGLLPLDDLGLLPRIKWDEQLEPHWDISEAGAQERLDAFLDDGIDGYKEGRNHPAQSNVSRLSPYLHWGQISPHQVWHAASSHSDSNDVATFLSEIGWREFSYSLLYHFPQLPRENLQEKFNDFPWRDDDDALTRWQKGMTGYPIVDAGMRELWQTGYMHNRVRMIVGSFLVKNLLLHWHHGEAWFWDCLVDADLANNSASWQWIAGCGADAAPYFRIFNPITQGEKFDASGEYTRRFVPELKNMPDKYLFKPWEAPQDVLERAGVTLGEDYPKPIVDVKGSRERALDAFKSLKS